MTFRADAARNVTVQDGEGGAETAVAAATTTTQSGSFGVRLWDGALCTWFRSHRRAAALLLFAAVAAPALLVALIPGPDADPPLRFWIREGDPSHIYRRPGEIWEGWEVTVEPEGKVTLADDEPVWRLWGRKYGLLPEGDGGVFVIGERLSARGAPQEWEECVLRFGAGGWLGRHVPVDQALVGRWTAPSDDAVFAALNLENELLLQSDGTARLGTKGSDEAIWTAAWGREGDVVVVYDTDTRPVAFSTGAYVVASDAQSLRGPGGVVFTRRRD